MCLGLVSAVHEPGPAAVPQPAVRGEEHAQGAQRGPPHLQALQGTRGARRALPVAEAVLTLRGCAGEAAGALRLAAGAFFVLASQPKEIIFWRRSNVNC